jgi:transporter family-2 protein
VTGGLARATAIGLVVLANTGAALQTRINGELGSRLHDGVAAGLISMAGGLVLLLVAVLPAASGRRSIARVREALRDGRIRWWYCLGGVNGGLFVASQGLTAQALGVTVFTVAVVAGTSAGSLAADRWGIGPGGRQPLTVPRVTGALLCVAAVVIGGSLHLHGSGLLVILPAVAGAGLAWQLAMNGRVGAVAQSSLTAALVNFAVAAVTLGLVFGGEALLRGAPSGDPPGEWWLYLGGAPGVVLVAVAAAVVSRIGVLVLGLAGVAGQLSGSVAIDAVAGRVPSAATWVAVALTAVAVWLSARRPLPPAGPERAPSGPSASGGCA